MNKPKSSELGIVETSAKCAKCGVVGIYEKFGGQRLCRPCRARAEVDAARAVPVEKCAVCGIPIYGDKPAYLVGEQIACEKCWAAERAMALAPKCPLCGQPMAKTRVPQHGCAAKLLFIVAGFITMVVLTFSMGRWGVVPGTLGLFLGFIALIAFALVGDRRKKVLKCSRCGHIAARE